MIDPGASDPWDTALQVLEPSGRPVWRRGRMFETTDTGIPTNWTVQLWEDGSLHLAPAAWLRDGYWVDFWEHGPDTEAAEIFRRERDIILQSS